MRMHPCVRHIPTCLGALLDSTSAAAGRFRGICFGACSAPAPPRCIPGDGHRDTGYGVAAALVQLKHAGQGKSCNAPRSWVTGWRLPGGERRAGVWQRWRFQAHSKLNGDGPHTLLLLCEQLGSYTNLTDSIGRQLQRMHTWSDF